MLGGSCRHASRSLLLQPFPKGNCSFSKETQSLFQGHHSFFKDLFNPFPRTLQTFSKVLLKLVSALFQGCYAFYSLSNRTSTASLKSLNCSFSKVWDGFLGRTSKVMRFDCLASSQTSQSSSMTAQHPQ